MCGIAGVLYADPDCPPEPATLRAMSAAIAHRGPDAEGFWTDPGLGLVHRRLSIIDLGGGDQPIGNEDGSVQIVFNGEIYNYQALRAQLESRGHRFKTNSDTEVLVHLYEDDGERLVERLRGMFAFALWDRTKRRLLLARDRLGIKPLYLARDAEKLVFASELKGVLAHPGVARDLEPRALEDYLAYGIVPGPRSILRSVEKLPPACTLTATAGRWDREPRRYWQLRFEPDPKPTAEEWQEAVRAKIDESVRLHMIADVPVGAFLSGGLDSGIVVGTAAGLAAEPLRTFSVGFSGAADELPDARLTADHYGTRHAEDVVAPDAATLLDELSKYFDEPFADSSAIPTYLVAKRAARDVKVVLTGDGGDEAFGGYARYAHDLREAAVRRRLPGWARSALGPMARLWPKADWLPRPLRAKTTLTNLALDAGPAYANTLQVCRLPLRRRLLSADVAGALNGHRPETLVCDAHRQAPETDPLAGMIAADVATLLPDDYLVKVDRATMAHGLEARPPLLDHELLELTTRIPSDLKVRDGQTKWLLKRACGDRLPPGLLSRPKRGFEVPVDAWLRGPLRDRFADVVLAPAARIGNLIDRTAAREIFQAHATGTGRHGGVLWGLLVLAHWCDRYRTDP